MAESKAFSNRINDQFRNKALWPKKIWMLLTKLASRTFVRFFSKSRHLFILDLGKGSDQNLYTLHNYEDSSTYTKNQQVKTSKKIAEGYDRSWCSEETISLITSYLVGKFGEQEFTGICHGSRIGKEVQWFNNHLPTGSYVLGTDIEPSATKFPNTIEHDFHEVKDEWLNSFDFVYSNSQDHAKNPKKALGNWLLSLNERGLLFIEHNRSHGKKFQDDADCWGVETEILPFLLLRWFGGDFAVIDMIPVKESNAHYILVVARV
jgi:SAM-dependent methyltransferase